jgi:hypothetical protein
MRPLLTLQAMVFESAASKVGAVREAIPSLSLVGRSNIRRGNDTVSRSIFSVAQVCQYGVESVASDSRAVLEQNPGRSKSVDCIEASAIRWACAASSESRASACCANIPARKARCEQIHFFIDSGMPSGVGQRGGEGIEAGPPSAGSFASQAFDAPWIGVNGPSALPSENGAGPQASASSAAQM